MKNIFLLLSLVTIPITFSCVDATTACDEILCQNDGACFDGSCICRDGFTGANCETLVCDILICEVPKICIDGECKCPPAYTGSDCTQEVVPTSVIVETIIITQFPTMQVNGDPWDPSSDPDLGIGIFDSNSELLWLSSIKEDINPEEEQEFQCNFAFTSGILATYSIAVAEWDDNDEFTNVGSLRLMLYQEGMGFPDTLQLISPDPRDTVLTGKAVLNYGF